jgi:hypothetical protein
VRLGGHTCVFPALSAFHYHHSQQGVHTHGWEICSGVQHDHDERKGNNTKLYFEKGHAVA